MNLVQIVFFLVDDILIVKQHAYNTKDLTCNNNNSNNIIRRLIK